MIDKFAVISHVLPPSPSGQAIVLHKLMKDLPSEKYCLISVIDHSNCSGDLVGSEKLPGKYYHLTPEFLLNPRFGSRVSSLKVIVNSALSIFQRARQIAQIALEEQCKLIISCTGEPYDLPAAYFASKRAKLPFIAYIFDDYANQWTGIERRITARLEPLILKNAHGVIVPNEYMAKEYFKRYGINCTVIHNPSAVPDLQELDRTKSTLPSDEITIVYTGSIYHAHYDAFRNLIAALEKLGRPEVKLHLYTDQPKSKLEKEGIVGPFVIYHNYIHQTDVIRVLRQADILFLPLAFNSSIQEVLRTAAPGKTGEYLSVGRPILVHAPQDTFVSWYFNEKRCGVVVDRCDSEYLAQEIERVITDAELRHNLGQEARNTAMMDFDETKIKLDFANFLQNIISGKR
ncbi:MAG TPA: glycosyltransferase [Desulfobacteria bacterium]|nr:glycosyltransferase [Desulfobacteria bacterium]